MDEMYGIGQIKQILNDPEDKIFYFLCNCKDGITGFFLIKLSEMNPREFSFLTLYSQKLQIGDANMFISRG